MSSVINAIASRSDNMASTMPAEFPGGLDLRRRHSLGRFDTPRPLAQCIADWAIRSVHDTVLEPSSGAGVFLHSAIYRLRGLQATDPRAGLWACDIDPVACREAQIETGLPDDHIWNTDLMGLVSEAGIRNRRFDVVVGNPPFVSVHTMSVEQRMSARAAAERLGSDLDRKASLWAYFLLACTRSLQVGGRIGVILPRSALHAGYARDIMHGVARTFGRSMMISVREPCFLAAGTKERVIVFCGDDYRGVKHDGVGPALIECAAVSDVRRVLSTIQGKHFRNVPRLNGHAVPHLLSPTASSVLHLEDIGHSHPLGDFADIKIGAVTGANDFFVLNEPDRRQWGLPLSSVVPVLLRLGNFTGLRFNRPQWKRMVDAGERCWLLMPNPDEKRASVLRYLNTFDATAREANRTFGKRSYWYRTVLPPRPHAFLKYMGSSGPYLIQSTFDCQCTNSTHAVYFKPHVDRALRCAILLSLRSSFSKLSAEFEGRSYGADALKLEPSEAKRVRFVLPSQLDITRIKRLFSSVHRLLTHDNERYATHLIDDWLYSSVPGLTGELPRSRVTALFTQAYGRRRGMDPGKLAITGC